MEITEFYWHVVSWKFREINVLRKNFPINCFDGKNLRGSEFPHRIVSVEITEILSHTFFSKNFVKATFLPKKLLNSWFDEIFFGESKFLTFPHWKNAKFTLTEKILRQIYSLVETLLSRKFCIKSVRVNFRHFNTVLSFLYSHFTQWMYVRSKCALVQISTGCPKLKLLKKFWNHAFLTKYVVQNVFDRSKLDILIKNVRFQSYDHLKMHILVWDTL